MPSARRGEAARVGAAEGEALGLDGRVDGLGEQRPGQAPAAQRAAGERLDGGGEAVGRGVAGRVGGGARGVDLVLGGAPEDLGEQLGLGREVAVDGAGRHAGRAATAATGASR